MIDFKELERKALAGTMPDALNPLFLFSTIDSALLRDIVSGKIDPVEIAKHTLIQRHGEDALKNKKGTKK
jgi:hypothetical protein